MHKFLKGAKVVRVVDGHRVEVGPIAESKFSEHVAPSDSFGKVPQNATESSASGAKDAIRARKGRPAPKTSAKTPTAIAKEGVKEGGTAAATAAGTAAGKGKTKSASSTAAQKRTNKAAADVATNLGTIQQASTVNEVMAIRIKEVDDHEAEMRALQHKLSEVDGQLKSTPRTRANIELHRKLVDRRDALRAEIVRKRGSLPSLAEMTQQMLDFYEWREQQEKQHGGGIDDDSAADIGFSTSSDGRKRARDAENNANVLKKRKIDAPVNTLSVVTHDIGDTRGGSGRRGGEGTASSNEISIGFDHVGVARISEVTFGAPIVQLQEFRRLESMFRAAADEETPEKEQNESTTNGKVNGKVSGNESGNADGARSSTADESPLLQENALADIDCAFDEAVRAELATTASVHDVQVVAFLISDATRGWNAIDENADENAENGENQRENASRAALGKRLFDAASAKAHGSTTASSSSTSNPSAWAGKQELEMTTIGSNRTHVPSGSKIRNRLNIKMKDIRNGKNVSMRNFCNVQKRQRTDQERETVDFVRYLGATHCNDVERDVTYDDPRCSRCDAVIDIDMRTGMETCHECGLAVYGKLGREIIPLEQPMHNKYQYLKVGHMKTILMRSQGKETIRIPEKVANDVKKQLSIERANLDEVDAFRVKRTLKKLGYTKWYDHMHHITRIVTNRPPHQFSRFEEELILSIFEHLVEPYELYRAPNQENFVYYYYALHKICQLLQYPKSVLRNFPLLQNLTKHRQKEAIWEKMMNYRGWPYYKS